MLRIAHAYSYEEDANNAFGLWSEDDPVLAIRTPREHYLQTITQRISRIHPVPVIATLVEGREPLKQLKDLQSENDLTVMTSRRRNWFSRLCRESMADALLDEVGHPTLLVRGYDAPADLTGAPLRRQILLPIEDPNGIAWSMDDLRKLASSDAVQVTVLPLTDEAAVAAQLFAESAARSIRQAATILRTEKPRMHSASSILAYSQENDLDLIALGLPQGQGAWAGISGSLLQSIARQSQIPVLVHRRPDS
jgi:nucleotide-binding universal stress UspA family protein